MLDFRSLNEQQRAGEWPDYVLLQGCPQVLVRCIYCEPRMGCDMCGGTGYATVSVSWQQFARLVAKTLEKGGEPCPVPTDDGT